MPKTKSSRTCSALEALLSQQMRAEKIPHAAEIRFHPDRRWRFDFVIVGYKIGVEVEGGTWAAGRHTRGSGFAKDCEKYNEAARLGWAVYRFTGDQIKSGHAIDYILRVLR